MNPIETAPKDRRILLHVSGEYTHDNEPAWIEGEWYEEEWTPIWLNWHGCGCCGDINPRPDGWLPLPE